MFLHTAAEAEEGKDIADADAVIAGRNFLVYSVEWDDGNTIPADTIAYGTAWGTPSGQTDPWENRGYTEGGLGMSMNLTRSEIRVDQEFDPLTRPITGRNLTMSTNLAEMTPANMQLASGMGELPAAVSPLPGVRGHQDLVIGSTLTDEYNSWGFDIRQPDAEAFRIIAYKALAVGNPSPRFTPDAPATIALEVSALVDTSTDPSRVALIRDVYPAT